jgi:hypothetical protein
MGEKVDPGQRTDSISSDVAGAFKKLRCSYCQGEWSPGRPANHRPGCPNTDTVK